MVDNFYAHILESRKSHQLRFRISRPKGHHSLYQRNNQMPFEQHLNIIECQLYTDSVLARPDTVHLQYQFLG